MALHAGMEAVAGTLSSVADHCHSTARQLLHPGAIEFWLPVLPAIAYWVLACAYDLLDRWQLPALEAYRMHGQAVADKKNIPTKLHVISRVLLQHAIQCAVSWAFTLVDPGMCERTRVPAGGGLQVGGGGGGGGAIRG